MASPGHRDNILSPDHDVVGIGVVIERVKGERNLFVTQIFGTTRQPLDLTRIRTQFLAQLNSQRTRLQLPLLEESDLLNKEAELSTATCFANGGRKNTRPRKPTGFKQITQISFIASNPLEAISEIPGLTGARAAYIGIGMRKGEDLSHRGTVCVVVVLGDP